MPRYILIDNNSGYIFGDTAQYAFAEQAGLTPVEAARLLDEREVGEFGRTYEFTAWGHPHDTTCGYHVYRADINGSDAVPAIHDGQSQDEIEAVMENCEFVGYVECISPRD